MAQLGPTFGAEIVAAGLGGLPFSWGSDGVFSGRGALTSEQNATLDAVIAAHDHNKIATPETISDRQFFQALAVQGLITLEEALAAVRVGAVPATLQALVNAMPEENQFAANMLLSGAIEFRRRHPLVSAIAQGIGWSSSQIDDLWRAAAVM